MVGRHARQYHPSRRRSGRGWRERRELRAGGGRARAGGLPPSPAGRLVGLRPQPPVKAGASFCLPHQIVDTAADVFARLAVADHLRGRDRAGFLDGLAPLLAEVNALHPFREGNGRTQRSFLSQLARDAGFRLDWAAVDRDANIDAARAAADGDLAPMRALLAPAVRIVDRSSYR